jgi:hypothetical protein
LCGAPRCRRAAPACVCAPLRRQPQPACCRFCIAPARGWRWLGLALAGTGLERISCLALGRASRRRALLQARAAFLPVAGTGAAPVRWQRHQSVGSGACASTVVCSSCSNGFVVLFMCCRKPWQSRATPESLSASFRVDSRFCSRPRLLARSRAPHFNPPV